MAVEAEQAIKEGNLAAALDALQAKVRGNPADVKQRVFLFQLLAVMGNWERALNQLEVAGDMDAAALPMRTMYREAVQCERFRAEVFAGRKSPVIFGEPPSWISHLIESNRHVADGKFAAASQLRDTAFEQAEATAGTIDGQPFQWIADADPRLGPVLEGIINGRYYWIPFTAIQSIDIEEPEDLRDLVWAPVHFTWTNGGEVVGLIPTRYPGSAQSEDDLIKLSRKTDWRECEDGTVLGLGQRMLATDAGEFALLDVRRIELQNEPVEAATDEGHG